MERHWKFCYGSPQTWLCAWLGACLIVGALAATAQVPPTTNNLPPPPQWPAEFVKDGTRLIIYQPQLRDWQKFRDLYSDTAVSITPSGGKPVMGAVSWRATTLTNTQTRIVVIKDIVVTSARFPSLDPAASAAMERLVRETYSSTGMTISLDRLLAGFKMLQEPTRPVLKSDPPAIYVSTKPAILVFMDGDPIRVPIEGTKLEYVVNTNWDLIYDKSDYYLLDEKAWLKAKELSGPWKVTKQLPPDMAKLPANENWDDVRKAVPPPPSGSKPSPRVFMTSKPAELLLFNGDPVYTRIPGTKLAYASNTENDVFIHSPDRQVYVLLSGRWFRAAKLEGPWSYAGNDLPDDFAKIPASNPHSHVLVSVPGTQAAQDAVLLAQVPTTAIVNRAEAEAQVKVVYSGEPQFKPIENTSVSYAVNTQEKVIKYGDLYYLCFQGVWFMSTSPKGPWKTADSVPKAIYEIPPSAPVYNVTYVTVNNPTPTTVESSYTAGYMGMFVLGAAVGACLAYGTGYYYPPYYYWGPHPWPVYYPYPYSYGYRAVYNPATGFYGVGAAVYGPYGSAGRAAWYNPSTGRYGRAATVQTAYGGRTAAQVYNPWTGNYASTVQGHNAYAQWGSSTIKYGDDVIHTGHIKTANNLYTDVNGNVYKRDSSGNWSKYDNGNWVPVQHNTGGTDSALKSGQNRQGRTGTDGQKAGGSDSVFKGRTDQQARTSATEGQRMGGSDSVFKGRQDEQGRAPGAEGQRVGGADSVFKGRADQQGLTQAGERWHDQSTMGQTQRHAPVSSDTMQQLNRDASARQQGAARERSFNRSAGAGGGGGAGAGRFGRRR